jgi:hypothetical protein
MPSSRAPKGEEARRYRLAAELALQQLEWVINYLRQNHKPGIARALQANRDAIIKRYAL